MPETRYIETVTYPNGLTAEEKEHTNPKAKKTREPYEVSDAELERESAEQVIGELSAKADQDITNSEMARFLKALAKLR